MDSYSRKKEPSVISSRVILDGIEDDDADAMKSSLPEHDIIRRATTVSLSYKNLLKIENLQLLQNVRTLRLDNNMITKIEGLSHLRSLTWLDLSFNRIRKIEGLDKLENLTDLSLYNNEIKTIAGLEGLVNLQCLSLGNNSIESLEQVLFLKRLPKLQVLCLDGNPIARAKLQQYRSFCLAFLPGLKYLDYALVLPSDIAAAKENGVTPDLMAAVEDKEQQRKKQKEAAEQRQKVLDEVTAANLEVVETLWPDLFLPERDLDYSRIKAIPRIEDANDEFRKNFDSSTAEFREQGMEKSARINDEITAFSQAVAEAVTANDNALAAAIASWEQQYQRCARNISVLAGGSSSSRSAHSSSAGLGGGAVVPEPSELDDLLLLARRVNNSAIRDELHLHGGLEEMTGAFEGVMLEALQSKVQLHEGYFRALEAMEATWHASVVTLSEAMVEGLKDGSIKLQDEELLTLSQDKEALLGAITSAHESHCNKLYKKEAEMKQKEEARCKGAVAASREKEFSRNRERLAEINGWMASVSERVGALRAELEAAADENDHHTARESLASRHSVATTGAASAGTGAGAGGASGAGSAPGTRGSITGGPGDFPSSAKVPPLPLG